MGVYVPGMEIPSNCEECDFLERIGLDKYRCKRTGKEFYSWEVGWGSEPRIRIADCPLIEVQTPHGKLCDADAVKECLDEVTDGPTKEYALMLLGWAVDKRTVIEEEE